MIESGGKEIAEGRGVYAIEFSHDQIKKICAAIEDLARRAGKPKRLVSQVEIDQEYLNGLTAKISAKLKDALDTQKTPKFESSALVKEIKDELKKELPEGDADAAKKLSKYYELLREKIFRDQVLVDRIRPHGRGCDRIRVLTRSGGASPRARGG